MGKEKQLPPCIPVKRKTGIYKRAKGPTESTLVITRAKYMQQFYTLKDFPKWWDFAHSYSFSKISDNYFLLSTTITKLLSTLTASP